MLDESNFITLIGNMGFPIAITIYLLHRFERKITELEGTIQQLIKVIESQNKG